MYTLVLTQAAAQELERESAYSESRWGRAHAEKYIRELIRKIQGLKKNPYLFRTHDEVLPELRLMTYKGNHVLYWIDETERRVIILGVPSIYREFSPEELARRVTDYTR